MTNMLTIENAKLICRNFSGKKGRYNPEGVRNFCVLLDYDIGEKLKRDGWNIKELKPRKEGDEPQKYLPVSVGFNVRPPKIVMISSSGKTYINEDEVNILDWAEFEKVDLIIRPREWDDKGTKRIKAWLKSIYVTIVEDDLDRKYKDIPDSAKSSIADSESEEENPF